MIPFSFSERSEGILPGFSSFYKMVIERKSLGRDAQGSGQDARAPLKIQSTYFHEIAH
jgi:hypothetical protein